MKLRLIVIALVTILIAAACSGDDPTPQAQEIPDEPTVVEATNTEEVEPTAAAEPTVEPQELAEEVVPTEVATEAMEPEPTTTVDRPEWQTVEMIDARTGETFTFADYAGKTVFVEPMATWCTQCSAQLRTVNTVRNQLSADDFVFIGLSVETFLEAGDLAAYQNNNGFDWRFSVLSEEYLTTLVGVFGRALTNPPSTPHFIIRPDGTFTDVDTGMESADELIQQLTEANAS